MESPRSFRIFISSTFRDFDRERDALRRVEIALRERLLPHGASVTLVDLRWGVHTTAAEGERELEILQVCLDEVARTRPLFVGLLGDRYGWVPDTFTAQTAAGRRDFSRPVTGRSVTELEIEYGVLNDADVRSQAAFFFRSMTPAPPAGFAEPAGSPSAGALDDLKRRIRDTDVTVVGYDVAVEADGSYATNEFERMATETIWSLIAPQLDEVTDPLERLHGGFAAELAGAFVDPDARISRVLRRLDERGETVHVVTGAAGSGRSSTLAALAARYRALGGRALFHSVPLERAGDGPAPERFVGFAGLPPGSSVADAVHALAAEELPVLLCLDAIDRSPLESDRAVTWLPDPLPPQLRVVVSSDTWPRYASRAVEVEVIDDLFPEAVVRAVIEDRFARLSKSVPRPVVDALAPAATVAGPLWTTLAADILAGLDATDFATVDRDADDPQAALTAMVTEVARGLDSLLPNLYTALFERASRQVAVDALDAVTRAATYTVAGAPSRELAVIASALAGRPLDDLEIARVRWALRGQLSSHGSTGWLSPAHDALRRTVAGGSFGDEGAIRAAIARALAPIRDSSVFAAEEYLAQALRLSSAGGAATALADAAGGSHPLGPGRAVRLLADHLVSAVDSDAGLLLAGVVASPETTVGAGWLVREAVFDSADRGASVSTVAGLAEEFATAARQRAATQADPAVSAAWLDLVALATYDRAFRARIPDDNWAEALETCVELWSRLLGAVDDPTGVAVRMTHCRADLARILVGEDPQRAATILDEAVAVLESIDLTSLPPLAPAGTDRDHSRAAVVRALASVDDARAFLATDPEESRAHLRQQLVRLWSLHDALAALGVADDEYEGARLDAAMTGVLDDVGRATSLFAEAAAHVDDAGTLAALERASSAIDAHLVRMPALTRLLARSAHLDFDRAVLLDRLGDPDGARRAATEARRQHAVVAALTPDDGGVLVDTIRSTALAGELEARHGDVVVGTDLLQAAGALAVEFLDPDLGSATATDAETEELVVDTVLRVLATWVDAGLTTRFDSQAQRFFDVGSGLMAVIDESRHLHPLDAERLHARLAATRADHYSRAGDHGRATTDLAYVVQVADRLVDEDVPGARWFRSEMLELGACTAERAGDLALSDRYLAVAVDDLDAILEHDAAPAVRARRRALVDIAERRAG